MAAADDSFATPSMPPAAPLSMAGVLRGCFRKVLEDVDDMLPCQVLGTDGRKWVSVKPLVKMGTTDGQAVSRAQIARIPVMIMGGGDFVLSFPIKAGDLGWIKASDRDTSLVMQGLGEDLPNTRRLHSFEDGVFVPHRMREWVLNDEDADRAVLSSVDGLTRIALGDGIVKVTATAIELVSDTLTHNGVNIGSTHTHDDVTTGSDMSGPPTP